MVHVWLNLTGKDLPTALSVPKPLVDLTDNTAARMKIGLKVDPEVMIITGYSYVYFKSQRKNGKLYARNGIGSRDPIQINWVTPSGRRAATSGDRIEGLLVMTKRPEKLGDIQAMTIVSQCALGVENGGTLEMEALTIILLKDFKKRPAIGLTSYQYHNKLLRPERHRHEFYDSDGTRILPLILNKTSPLPLVFECRTEGGETTPYIAAADIDGDDDGFDDFRLLDLNYVDDSHGITHSVYEVPARSVGKKSNFICSAADGDVITNLYFRMMIIDPVRTTTENETSVTLNEETFKNVSILRNSDTIYKLWSL
jgi:hypothetical protein